MNNMDWNFGKDGNTKDFGENAKISANLAPYIVDMKTFKVYINHGGFFHQDNLRPYWGKITKAGFAADYTTQLVGNNKPETVLRGEAWERENGFGDTKGEKVEIKSPKMIETSTLKGVQEFAHNDPRVQELPADMRPLEGGKYHKVGLSDAAITKDKAMGFTPEVPAPAVEEPQVTNDEVE